MIFEPPVRTDIPLQNSTILRFLRKVNPAFDVHKFDSVPIEDYKGRYVRPNPEIYTTAELEGVLGLRGYGVYSYDTMMPEQMEHDFWVYRVHKIAHNINRSRKDGLTEYEMGLIGDWRNMNPDEAEECTKLMFRHYGIRQMLCMKSVTKPRHVMINKKFIDPHHHKDNDEEYLAEILIRKIIDRGPMSRRDLINYSRRYRGLDELGRSDVHFIMRRDPRVEYLKLTRGRGSGQMVYQPTEPDTEDFI